MIKENILPKKFREFIKWSQGLNEFTIQYENDQGVIDVFVYWHGKQSSNHVLVKPAQAASGSPQLQSLFAQAV